MSETWQGPGWWLASDGRWYPPDQVPGPFPGSSAHGGRQPSPGYGPPPYAPGHGPTPGPSGYGYPPGYPACGYPPMAGTNGLAVASLVCSLLWVFGLGGVLAIVFGFVARSQIKRSGDSQRGRGLALAGIIIGVAGVMATALLITVAVVVDHRCHQPGNCTFTTFDTQS